MCIEKLTLIFSMITSFAAIVAPIITALINQRGAYKAKSAEMFFTAKADAYLDFLATAAEYGNPLGTPSSEKSRALHAASTHALLFASQDTQDKIGRYGQMLTQNDFRPESIQALSNAHRDVILVLYQN